MTFYKVNLSHSKDASKCQATSKKELFPTIFNGSKTFTFVSKRLLLDVAKFIKVDIE